MRPHVARPNPARRSTRTVPVAIGLALGLAALGTACTDLEPLGPDGVARALVTDARDQLRQRVDLLFVVDNSATMAEKQLELTTSFAILTDHMRDLDGKRPDLHVAVISSDMGAGELYAVGGCGVSGDNGIMQRTPRLDACPVPSDAFLDVAETGTDGDEIKNFDGALEDAFACIAQLGNQGCNFEQPLAAMRRALDGSIDLNDGFLRDDAVLAVVFLTDEDDCSVQNQDFFRPEAFGDRDGDHLSKFRCFRAGVECKGDDVFVGTRQDCVPEAKSKYLYSVDDYTDFLRGLKPDEHDLVVSAITGTTARIEVEVVALDDSLTLKPSCSAAGGPAYPAVRLQSFAAGFPMSGHAASLCSGDGDFDILDSTSKALHDSLGNFCLAGNPTDVDLERAGLQVDCSVEQVAASGDRIEMPACEDWYHTERSTVTPCYAIKTGVVNCTAYPTQLGLQVNWGERGVPTPGYRTEVRCLVDDTEPPLGRW